MNVSEQALAAGFTHVKTLAGNVPLQLFFLRDALGMTFDAAAACIKSPARPATTFEEEQWELLGNPPCIGLLAWDKWPVVRVGSEP
jgi:hypothetical protein